MAKVFDGGPVLPTMLDSGMSLRAWFAGQALPAVMAEYFRGNRPSLGADHSKPNCAIIAYQFADALIAELEKRT